MKVFIKTKADPFLGYTVGLRKNLDRAVRTTAFHIERDWKLGVPVDTGAYRASIHTITADSSDKRIAGAAEVAGKKRPGVKILGIGVTRSGFVEAYVVAGVDYAKYVNNTHRTKPFAMEKAVRKNDRRFRVEVGKALRAAGRPNL